MTIRVLLADDHALVRGALAALLEIEPDLEIVAQVDRGDLVVPAAREAKPDLCLLDIEMPGMTGIEATALLQTELPDLKVMIVTTFGRPGYVRRAMEAGASAFVVKDTPAEELATIARQVMAGETVVDPSLAAESLRDGADPLTDRERDLLRILLDNESESTADLAARAFLSAGTTRNYLSSAMAKTGTRTRTDAARFARQKGWL